MCPIWPQGYVVRTSSERLLTIYKNIEIAKYLISNLPIDGVIHFIKEKIFPDYIRDVYSSTAYPMLFEVILVFITDNINYYNSVVETFLPRFRLRFPNRFLQYDLATMLEISSFEFLKRFSNVSCYLVADLTPTFPPNCPLSLHKTCPLS